ncbi:MAG: S26 family signal peptidase, partial [Duncaniella sp.]|nr:S26 family signal peptidase [Duncaniella sp.]
QNPDYYTLVKMYGRDAVHNNPQTFGEIIYRPVDRRENYVKRAIGLPGDRIKIVDGIVYVNGEEMKQPENVQFNYYFQFKNGAMTPEAWDELGISVDDRHEVPVTSDDVPGLRTLGFTINPDGSVPPIYASPLTAAMVKALETNPNIARVMKMPAPKGEPLYPDVVSNDWTRSDYGEIWIPRKGAKLIMGPRAWQIYGRVIRDYEGNHDAEFRNGKLYINGEPQDSYTFKMDYYFMMGDNRDNSLDSRYWGFVPEDHIVGRPERVLISFDKDKGLLNGGIRWNRIFRAANTDEY